MLYALHKYHLAEGAIITREETYIYFCELPVEKQVFVFDNLDRVATRPEEMDPTPAVTV